MYSKLNKKRNVRKVAKLLYIFLTAPDKVEKYGKLMQSNSPDNCIHHSDIMVYNLFDRELQLGNTKPMIKNKLKELISELKSLKFRQY